MFQIPYCQSPNYVHKPAARSRSVHAHGFNRRGRCCGLATGSLRIVPVSVPNECAILISGPPSSYAPQRAKMNEALASEQRSEAALRASVHANYHMHNTSMVIPIYRAVEFAILVRSRRFHRSSSALSHSPVSLPRPRASVRVIRWFLLFLNQTSSRARSFEARGAQSKLARTGSASITSPKLARRDLAAQRRTRPTALCSPLCRSS